MLVVAGAVVGEALCKVEALVGSSGVDLLQAVVAKIVAAVTQLDANYSCSTHTYIDLAIPS